MPKAIDVVHKLIEKTQSGELVWENRNLIKTRFANYCDCTFRLSSQLNGSMSSLFVNWDDENGHNSQTLAFEPEITPLLELLDELYPFKKATKSQAVKLALKCLSDECHHSSD